MKIKSLFIASAIALAASLSFAESIKTLEPLSKAPDFSLTAQDGKTYSLKDYKGKIVVLEWFNNDCPYVEKHYGTGNMQKLQEKYTAQGVVWLSVSSTKPENAFKAEELSKIHTDRKAKSTAVLMDTNGKMARDYGAKTTPHLYVIGTDGKIAYMGAIDDNDSFRKDTVEKSKSYISAALDAVLGKKKVEVPQTKPYGCAVKI
jgi:peroxiredoxin